MRRGFQKRLGNLERYAHPRQTEDLLHVVRMEALDRLPHDDRRRISHIARQYILDNQVAITPEQDAVLTRWGSMIASVTLETTA